VPVSTAVNSVKNDGPECVERQRRAERAKGCAGPHSTARAARALTDASNRSLLFIFARK
jgi:hypothetical protein